MKYISLYNNKKILDVIKRYYSIKPKEFEGRLEIGDAIKNIKLPTNPELVPRKYVQTEADGTIKLSQSALHHLRWMIQKDNLKQDMFLLGYPGLLRRNIAMQYLELTQREVEYIALSRDTTESDLKQRREIKNKAAVYYDQCAVRAAINGRVLILDGVEHAERNVLPILNNLLENREMHLENGKFLMAPSRYDKLLETYSQKDLDNWGLIRVSEDFRIIALGLPTIKYKGTPLDPPLRSRFQARNISHFSYEENLSDLIKLAPNVDNENLKKLLSFGTAILNADLSTNLPDFPIDNLNLCAKLMNNNPNISVHDSICFLYPYKSTFQKDNIDQIQSLLESFKIKSYETFSIKDFKINQTNDDNFVKFSLDKNDHILIPSGRKKIKRKNEKFVELDYQKILLSKIIQVFAVADLCLIGPKGVGKNALINQLMNLIGQSIEPVVLYEDMTSRDLIQQRITTPDGDTIWKDSPLIRAAKEGSVVILDGINRLHKSTLSVLQRIIHDREIQLCDGSVLLRQDRYNDLLLNGFTVEELQSKGVFKIHNSFKIIALAEPTAFNTNTTAKNNWLTPEILSLFLFLEIRPLQQNEEYQLIKELYGNIDDSIHKVINLSHILRESKDPIMENLSATLSTRQLLKIANRISVYPPSNDIPLNSLYEIIQNTFLSKFLPALPRNALKNAMKKADIEKPTYINKSKRSIEVKNGILKIGMTEMKIENTEYNSKIPNTLFYEMPQHVETLERLLQDFLIGEHILLVGNQGVGKNKLVDKLLELMNKPREYLQLHRDTTVQSLTVQASLKDGTIVYEDSPLVKAVRNGHVLVIDEVDKAPVNVTCILRTLVENGEMALSDGRKIMPYLSDTSDQNVIETHKNFRMICLANRPGFPFMGNDFFASLGDIFSCHAIDNPSPESEIYLLQQYGPSVPTKTLATLVNAFGELRTMADEGILNYPYSTREVVNIVKHLEQYPNDSISELIGNVLDFDKYSPEILEQVTEVLIKHGLPIEAYAKNEIFKERRKKELRLSLERKSGLDVSSPKHGKVDPKNDPHVGGNTWAGGTGGRDTAGLGGKGGPYRLDAGHDVHQLSDEEKADVPEEVKRAARKMNREAFEKKLKEIKMSPYEHKVYAQYSQPVHKQVQQLKAILNSLQTKSNERQWLRYQTSGELDDGRLIEGITGEKNIYRKRTDANPWADNIQEKPKRLKLVVDVSGSMYRFNGYDGRLDRELEAVVMVMEAFEGYESKIVYDITGHSGEGYNLPFVVAQKPPKDNKERLETIKMMHAHSQFCWPGDHTLKATENAILSLEKEEDIENSIVIVLSDANLERYGIRPNDLANALMKGEPKVQGFVIFIGSLSKEADLVNSKMPPGHSYICMDLAMLPQILQQIFTSSIL